MKLSFFKPKQLSPSKKSADSLCQVFRHENFEQLDDKLCSLHTVAELIKENRDSKKAWQFEHVPEMALRKIITKWLELMARKEAFITKINKPASKLTEREIQEIAFAISQDKFQSIKDYNDNLSSYYDHLNYLECLNKIDFYLNTFGILLVAVNKEFGCISSSALDLSSVLGIIMSSVMMFSDFLTIFRIYYRNRTLDPKHYFEITFLVISIALNGCGIISSAPMLTVLAGVLSVTQSLVELWGEYSKYIEAPEGTDRKIAHLQQCFALAVRIIHSSVSLILVTIMLCSILSTFPAILSLGVITAGLMVWNSIPEPWRQKAKSIFGLPKKTYSPEQAILLSGTNIVRL